MDIHNSNFFYQEAAEPVVESILALMNQGVKEFESYDIWPYDVPISDPEDNHNHFNWRFSVCRAEEDFSSALKYDIIGSAGRDCFDEPSISIGIIIPRGKHQKKILVDRAELFDVVSHELHHIAQNIDNNTYQKNIKETGRLTYFLDPFEIEAFHVGIRAQSCFSGRSFRSIARDYLRRAWPECRKEDLERIVYTWENTSFPAFAQNLKLKL